MPSVEEVLEKLKSNSRPEQLGSTSISVKIMPLLLWS